MLPTVKRLGSARRAMAMTELAILLTPYGLLVLGTVLVSQLCLGRQEAIKSVAWTAARPGQQQPDDVGERFFQHVIGTAYFAENPAYTPSADPQKEEPVLPYTEADIRAVIVRESTRAVQINQVVDGEIQSNLTESQTALGKYLSDREIDDRAGDIALALGEWLNYSRAESGYTYALHAGGVLPLETDDSDADAFRQEFKLGGPGSGEYSFQTSQPNPDAERGYHLADANTVDVAKLSDYEADVPDLPVAIIGDDAYQAPAESAFVFYDKDYKPE